MLNHHISKQTATVLMLVTSQVIACRPLSIIMHIAMFTLCAYWRPSLKYVLLCMRYCLAISILTTILIKITYLL